MTTNEIVNEAATLSHDLPTLTAEINAYKRVAGEAIFEIGKRLKSVRDARTDAETSDERRLARQREEAGGWIRWLEDHVEFTRQTSTRAIQSYEQFGTTSYHFDVGKIFEMLSLPSDVDRSEFVTSSHTIPSSGATKTVDEMTVRELREVKAALKAEKAAREKAESDYETVRDTLESMREQPPRIEVRTEYVRDESAEDRLRRYESRFGDIGIYEQNVVKIDNVSDISASIQTFEYEARVLLKKYGFLSQYKGEIPRMHGAVVEDYGNTLDALLMFARDLRDGFDSQTRNGDIINI